MAEQDDSLKKIEIKKKAYISCFSTNSGKIVLEDLERHSHIKTTTYSPSVDAIDLAFREGQRSICLHIKTMMEFDVARIKELIEAQNQEEEL